jgi:DNA-binding NtrC family response regulator
VVTRFENDLIEQALEQTRWNKNRAARLLQLNRTTLLEKIKKRGLQPRPSPL